MTLTVTPTNATGKRARVSIRPIEAVDADGLSTFYATLGPASRARRFFGACRGISDADAERFASVDHVRDDGFVAVLAEQGPADGQIVGHATLTTADDAPPEIAFAVADGWQGRGIGTDLLQAVLKAAQRRGHPRVSAMLLADNVAMRRLLARAGRPWRVTGFDGSIIEVQVDVEPVAIGGTSR